MSTLKFKSIITDKKLGHYGDIIEYSTSEKIPVALQQAVTDYPPFKDKYLVAVTKVDVQGSTVSQLGDKLKKKWANNAYSAFGKATLSKRHVTKDVMMLPTEVTFALKFEDCLSANGLPELRTVSIVLE